MEQARREVGLPVEPLTVGVVGAGLCGQHLQRFGSRQPWMRREIHLAHAAGSERPEDDETGEDMSFAQQGHVGIVSTRAAESR